MPASLSFRSPRPRSSSPPFPASLLTILLVALPVRLALRPARRPPPSSASSLSCSFGARRQMINIIESETQSLMSSTRAPEMSAPGWHIEKSEVKRKRQGSYTSFFVRGTFCSMHLFMCARNVHEFCHPVRDVITCYFLASALVTERLCLLPPFFSHSFFFFSVTRCSIFFTALTCLFKKKKS